MQYRVILNILVCRNACVCTVCCTVFCRYHIVLHLPCCIFFKYVHSYISCARGDAWRQRPWQASVRGPPCCVQVSTMYIQHSMCSVVYHTTLCYTTLRPVQGPHDVHMSMYLCCTTVHILCIPQHAHTCYSEHHFTVLLMLHHTRGLHAVTNNAPGRVGGGGAPRIPAKGPLCGCP